MKLHSLLKPAVLAGFVLMLATATSAMACDFHYRSNTDPGTQAIINDPSLPDPPISDADCQRFNHFADFLKANDIAFAISSDQFVNSGVSTAWAVVELKDHYGLMSRQQGLSTRVQADPDDTVARRLRYYAIVRAMFMLDLDGAIQNLRQTEIKDGLKPIPVFH